MKYWLDSGNVLVTKKLLKEMNDVVVFDVANHFFFIGVLNTLNPVSTIVVCIYCFRISIVNTPTLER